MSQTPNIEIRPFLNVFTLLERSREVQLDGSVWNKESAFKDFNTVVVVSDVKAIAFCQTSFGQLGGSSVVVSSCRGGLIAYLREAHFDE